MSDKPIEIYGTTWCPDCHRARRFLEAHELSYEWYDIEKDPQALVRANTARKNNKRVPTIVFPDGSVLIEPSNAELEEKLNQTGG
jgi:glutaredoxin-like protein